MSVFRIGGTLFTGKPLPPEKSLDALAILAPGLGIVLDSVRVDAVKEALQEGKEAAVLALLAECIKELLKNFKLLRDVAPYFVSAYQVEIDGRSLPLETFKREAFEGKPLLQVAWLIAAVKSEFGDFLAPNGWSTLKDLLGVLGLPVTFPGTGQSGESSTPK